MNCQQVGQYLPEYLGDELESTLRHDFEQHLRRCAACQAMVAGLAGAQEAMRAVDSVSWPQAARRTGALRVVVERSTIWRLGLGLLKAAALIGVGVWLGWGFADSESPGRANQPVAANNGQSASNKMVASAAQRQTDLIDGINPKWLERRQRVEGAAAATSFARRLALLNSGRR